MTSYFPFLRTHKYRQRWGNPHLTHWSWDKKAGILLKTFTKTFPSMIFYQNFTEFVQGPINITSTLVWVMAWCQTGNKPLPEPMMTQFNEEYKSHWVKLKVKYCHETSVRFQYKDHFSIIPESLGSLLILQYFTYYHPSHSESATGHLSYSKD